MYIENYDRKEFPYREFFLKLILIIVFMLLLAWVLTIVFKDRKESKIEKYNEVFSNNIDKMTGVATSYYNENNLPIEVGNVKELSLNDMLEKKLITKIVDSNGNACNKKKSYIKITKKEKEYLLKVNLVCDKLSDYIVIHLSKSNECKNKDICEDKEITKKTVNNNIIINNSYTISKKKKSTTNKGSIEVVDTTNKNYLYEYIKTNNSKFTSWSNWNKEEEISCNTPESTCNNNDINCLKEIKIDKSKITTTQNKNYNTTKNSIKYNGISNLLSCSNYNYIKIDNNIYKTSINSNYSLINNITSYTKKSVGNWEYKGQSSYNYSPIDTINVRYILVNIDDSNCSSTCQNLSQYYYDKYIYNDSLIKINNLPDNCNTKVYKNIPTYFTKQEMINFNRVEYITKDICYKYHRTRNIISYGTTSKKWSIYNNKVLLNDGYYYSGKKK